MSSSEAQQIEELKKELEEVKAKNEKLEMELQEGKGKYEKLEKELRELKEKDNHHHEISDMGPQKRNSNQANFSPIQFNAKRQQLYNQLSTFSLPDQLQNDNTIPDWAKQVMNTMGTLIQAAAALLKDQPNPQEAIEEDRRQHSVVVAWLPESTKESPTERASEDHKSILGVLDHCDVECLPTKVYRMGEKKKDGRPRLLKVELPTRGHVRRLLKTKANLKSSEKFSKVSIRESLSQNDLAEHYRLVNLCKSNRQSHPASDFIIFANHVIPRSDIPTFRNDQNYKCICHNN